MQASLGDNLNQPMDMLLDHFPCMDTLKNDQDTLTSDSSPPHFPALLSVQPPLSIHPMSGSQAYRTAAIQQQMMLCKLPTWEQPLGHLPKVFSPSAMPAAWEGREGGTTYHKQHIGAQLAPCPPGVPASIPGRPKLVKTSPQLPQAHPRLGETGFTRPPLFGCQ